MADMRAALIAAGASPSLALAWAEPIAAAAALHDITTPARIAAFLAQCSHESLQFRRTEEDLFYSSPNRICLVFGGRVTMSDVLRQRLARNPQALANCVYAGINGNGDEASADGWKYRGRGLIQLTGRRNYRDIGDDCGRDYETHPELVAEHEDAALAAAAFWSAKGCNPLADRGRIDDITSRVNGRRMLAARERRELTDAVLKALQP
jgi:putative chitinase